MKNTRIPEERGHMFSIEVTPIHPDDIPAAAGLFAQDFSKLRETAPELAPDLADPAQVEPMLAHLFDQRPGLAARQSGQLVGYLGAYLVPDFRGTARLGAYVPEWGHCAVAQHRPQVYQALYGAASAQWTSDGCRVYAITTLAHNHQEREFWFWNGFGLTVVDALRPMQPLPTAPSSPLAIRKASPQDADSLHALDVEHRRHYSQPPVLMAPQPVTSRQAFNEFLSQPENAVWMAWDGPTPAGFMRFDGYEVNGARLLEGEGGIYISGAYVRPGYRGQRAAQAMLDAALREYSGRGYRRCVVDFESINPEARSFWLKYFQPVAFSLLRVPEITGWEH